MSIVKASPEAIDAAAAALRGGGLIAFPTETVYGLGADAGNARAVAALFEAKARPRFNPLIVHVSTPEAAGVLGQLTETGAALARAFWPGPLTLVLARRPGCPVADLATAGLDTVAVRVPAHPVAQALLQAAGVPVAAPSANRSGHVSPTTAEHVAADFAAAGGGPMPIILDGGASPHGLESTVVDATGADPVVLRLESIADVAGAATRRSLAGSEDSFALTFSGPLGSPLDSGIHTLRHARLGSFELFASPVDEPERSRTYEVVVDRSVPEEAAPRAAAPAVAPKDPEDDAPAAGGVDPGGAAADSPRTTLLRRASLRRAGRWLRCELVLARSVDAERVRVRLMRNGHVLARAGGAVEGGRAVLRLESERPLTAARYTLVVTAVHADGTRTAERRRVSVR